MALFGSSRDVSLIRSLNKELLHDIISQQVSFYKYKLGETKHNIYGEASNEKFFDGPYLFFCLINKSPQQQEHVEEGVSFNRNLEIAFYADDLEEENIILEIGDVILFEENYYEVAGLIQNQFFAGKDPKYTNSSIDENGEYTADDNPLNTGLQNYGNSISIVCRVNYIPADKLNISPYKERM